MPTLKERGVDVVCGPIIQEAYQMMEFAVRDLERPYSGLWANLVADIFQTISCVKGAVTKPALSAKPYLLVLMPMTTIDTSGSRTP